MIESPAGLYLHVPFCSRVCPYCDFAVRTGDRSRRGRFVDHLLAEIEVYAGYPLSFDTIYFGGGTPSSLEPGDLSRIVEAARQRLDVHDSVQLFLEVNPDDVDDASVSAWSELGVHMLSLGVQTFDPGRLAFLGRRHSPDAARRATALALQARFPTVSIDLIYGLPGQSADAWRHDLDRALELGVQHVSCYQLTIHRRTRFALLEKRGTLIPLPADEQADLFRLTHRHLNAAGLEGYEVSQFAAGAEHRSRHNLKYWNHTPYLGLGPSAHSYHDRRRWWNVRRTDPWQERIDAGTPAVEGTETLDDRALALEALMTGLRTYAGVDCERLRARWNVDLPGRNAKLLDKLQSEGLVECRGNRLVPTLEGLAVADGMAELFDL